jgi:hypothetical protein
MGYTKEYLMWLLEKYGEDGEDLDELLERLGDDSASFGRMPEFARDVLADAVERSRDQGPRWDAFMSYAGKHKDMVATPLTKQRRDLGLKIWFDNDEYPHGDEQNGILYRFIHEGIALSRIGVVVVSPEYVAKEWTTQEYCGLRLKGVSTLFLVLHNADSKTLSALDPELAAGLREASAGVASTAKNSTKEIAQQIADFVEAVAKLDQSAD